MGPEFFPLLKRRTAYSCKDDGTRYSYRYFRKHHHGEIAEDCQERCVYCDSHEDETGGREVMEIDHFRPYSLPGFEHLENEPENFNHACRRCNSLKSDKWPSTQSGQCHDGNVGFIDPFSEPRSKYFAVSNDGELTATLGPAAYIIRVLALNRRLLKLQRQRRIFCVLLEEYESKNKPRWEAAAAAPESVDRKELERIAMEFREFRRLRELSAPKGIGR